MAADSTSFKFDIVGFVNPFSQLKDSGAQNSKFKIEHYGGNCDSPVATACNPDTCKVKAPEFSGPDQTTLGTPTSEISHPSGINYVGASDGEITFTMTAGIFFPKYGGTAILSLPNWYGAGTEPVFTVD